jgi:hypothetical protein
VGGGLNQELSSPWSARRLNLSLQQTGRASSRGVAACRPRRGRLLSPWFGGGGSGVDETVKRRCLSVLRDLSDARAMTALVNVVECHDPVMADHLRQFRATGQSYPYGFVWGAESVELRGTQYVVIRAIPKPLGIRFACGCARQVLQYLDEAHPAERSPLELIELVEAWASGSVTKKVIRAKLTELTEFASRIDREWHRAYGSGQFDSMPRPELDLSQRPLFAVDVVGYAAQSVGLSKSSTAWLASIDRTAHEHMEVESIGQGKRGVRRARNWQLKFLAELIETAD